MKKILFITPFDLQKRNKINAAAANRVDLIIRGLKVNNKNFIYDFFAFYSERKGVIKWVKLLLKSIKLYTVLSKYDYLYIYGEVWSPFLFRIAKWNQCKIIIERCEYPVSLIAQGAVSLLQRYKEKRYLHTMKYAWMLISCSNALINYYRVKVAYRCYILNLPLVVDCREFEMLSDWKKEKLSYITYCGNMGNNKDGVNILLCAFSRFLQQHKGYRLRLIGSASTAEMEQLYLLAKEMKIEKDIDFLGYMPHKEVIKELYRSSLLVLSRPANKQAEGGMPSKLAEYLLTGNPTLVTDVGEIGYYVKDTINCFLSLPDSPEAFCERMEYIVTHPEEAREVADKGKKVAEQFDYVYQTKQISNILG